MCRVGLVLTESSTDCCLALVKTAAGAAGTRVRVKVTATVDCTGGQVAACPGYQEKLQSDADTEQLGTVEVPEPNEPETTPTRAPATVGPSDSSSDSGATTSSS